MTVAFEISSDMEQKLWCIFAIGAVVGIIIPTVVWLHVKDEKKKVKELINKVKFGNQQGKEDAAEKLINEYLRSRRHQKKILDAISNYMPPKWHDVALDVVYPPKKSKKLVK